MNNLSVLKVMTEASQCDTLNFDTCTDAEVDNSFNDLFSDIDEFGEDLIFNIEAVHGWQSGDKFLIESDSLFKFMESNDLALEEAYDAVIEHYNLDESKTFLVIESKEFYKEILTEAKKAKRPRDKEEGLGKMQSVFDYFGKAKKKGIKLITKKKKGKK